MDDVIKTQLALWALEYVSHLETSITEEVCKCAWIDSGRTGPNGGALRVLSHAHPICPVHTKEGRIIGFLEWCEPKGLSLMLSDPASPVIAVTEEAKAPPTDTAWLKHGPSTEDNDDGLHR